ncbi:hypothetical protein [Chryseobacterium sp. T1]
MEQIILTVQSCEKVTEKCKVKYRLGISLYDSKNIFKERSLKVILILEEKVIITKTICGPPLNKGFDLYQEDLDTWIKEKKFCNYEKGKPTKLIFEILENIQETYIKLKFLKKK